MLKIVHLLAGAAALLIALVPLLGSRQAELLDADGVALSLIGLINLLLATFTHYHRGLRQQLQAAVSVLLLLAALLQALAVTHQLPSLAGQPTLLCSLVLALLATFLHLGANMRLPARAARSSHSAPAAQLAGNRETGTVKWFNTSKGFGFISRDGGDDIFVHFRAIRGEGHRVLIEGQRVEYTVMQRDKGLQAEDVVAAAPGRR